MEERANGTTQAGRNARNRQIKILFLLFAQFQLQLSQMFVIRSLHPYLYISCCQTSSATALIDDLIWDLT